MKICFVETESMAREYFSARLEADGGSHELVFVDTVEEAPEDVEVLSIFVHSRVTAEFMDAHPALRLVCTRSTGYDHVDLAAANARKITICRVPSYGENTVAEHSFALLLAISRRLRQSMAAYEQAQFSYEALRGFDLMGKTFGVIGTGRIGLHAVRIARGFQMEVLAYDVKTQPLVAATFDFAYVPFEELLARADVVSLYIPLSDQTRHIINRRTLALCRKGVVLINTARGGLVDSEALLEALESGRVGAAGLDVLEDERLLQQDSAKVLSDEVLNRVQQADPRGEPLHQRDRAEELRALVRDSRLIDHPGVIFTPHSAFNSAEAVARINDQTLRNIREFIAGRPVNVVSP